LNGTKEEIEESLLKVFEDNHWPYLIMDVASELEAVDFTPEEREEVGLPKESELDTFN